MIWLRNSLVDNLAGALRVPEPAAEIGATPGHGVAHRIQNPLRHLGAGRVVEKHRIIGVQAGELAANGLDGEGGREHGLVSFRGAGGSVSGR